MPSFLDDDFSYEAIFPCEDRFNSNVVINKAFLIDEERKYINHQTLSQEIIKMVLEKQKKSNDHESHQDTSKSQPIGWICPRCNKGLAPWVGHCSCHVNEKEDDSKKYAWHRLTEWQRHLIVSKYDNVMFDNHEARIAYARKMFEKEIKCDK